MASGIRPSAVTDWDAMLPNCDPAYEIACTGPAGLYTTIGATPRNAPFRQLTLARLTSLVICRPARSIVNRTGEPAGCALIALPIWFQLWTGCPATVTILSPDRKPAIAAGDRGSPCAHVACCLAGTQRSTLTVVPD